MHHEKYYKVYFLYRPEKAKEYVPNETFLPRLYEEPPQSIETLLYKTFSVHFNDTFYEGFYIQNIVSQIINSY